MARILLVEDDKHLRFGIAFNLKKEGHELIEAGSAEEALAALDSTPDPDLGLFDLMLPGRSGLELLETLREGGRRFPVMMLTARSDESDAVAALSLGADDYVRKPFGLSELVARIAAVLRRSAAERPDREGRGLRLGDIRLDLDNFRAQGPGGEFALTTIEAEILRVLAEKTGELVRREDLLEKVWGFRTGVLTRTLDNHVARLRKKIEADPAAPRHLVTIHGQGYKLMT